MRNLRMAVYLCALVSVVTFFACSSSNNNPTSSNTGNGTFTFAVGDTFHFSQWKTDANNKAIPTTHVLIKEVVVKSGVTIGGQSNVYMAIDTTTDTTGRFITYDTVYYYTDGTSISVYGLIAKLIYQYSNGGISVPPKWNKMIDAGNTGGWLTDTTTATISGITGTEQTNGKDTGMATIQVGSTAMNADEAVHHGTISAGIAGTAQILLYAYATYTPTVIARYVAASTTFAGSPVDGVILQLDSYTAVPSAQEGSGTPKQ